MNDASRTNDSTHTPPCKELAVLTSRTDNIELWQERANGDTRYIRGRMDSLNEKLLLLALGMIGTMLVTIVNFIRP